MQLLTKIIEKLTFAQVMCMFVISLCMAYLFWFSKMSFYHEAPKDTAEIKQAVIGLLIAAGSYIFGTTQQSSKKDDTISNMANNQTPAPVVPATPDPITPPATNTLV